MQRIDITAICKVKELDLSQVAAQLFPKNKHPRLALNRVIAGDSALDENQISKFSLMTGISIGNLFSGNEWRHASKESIHVFTSTEFRAELDTTNWTTRLFHNESMFHEHILHNGSITLTSYLELLNSEIIKFTANADFRN